MKPEPNQNRVEQNPKIEHIPLYSHPKHHPKLVIYFLLDKYLVDKKKFERYIGEFDTEKNLHVDIVMGYYHQIDRKIHRWMEKKKQKDAFGVVTVNFFQNPSKSGSFLPPDFKKFKRYKEEDEKECPAHRFLAIISVEISIEKLCV